MNPGDLFGAKLQELGRLGVATVYEASGREGLIDLELHQIVPSSRVAGPARTVLCAQGDNQMVHAVMALAQPGEVLVIAMPEPEAVGLVGELLAVQALGRGVAGMLIGAAVRDREELRDLGIPIWSRFVRARGATRTARGSLGQPVVLGGAVIRNGDLIVMDADGAVVVPAERLNEVLEAAKAREVLEQDLRSRFKAGELSIDVYGLRGDLEDLLG